MDEFRQGIKPERIRWLPFVTLFINVGVGSLLLTYDLIGLAPSLPPEIEAPLLSFRRFAGALVALLPTAASVIYLWPTFRWLRQYQEQVSRRNNHNIPRLVVERGGNAPLALAGFCVAVWFLVDILLVLRVWTVLSEVTLGTAVYFFARPIIAGLIAGITVYFLCEYLCRIHVWPTLFQSATLANGPRIWKLRVVHRLFLQMIAICLLPLTVVIFTALVRFDKLQGADPILLRVILVIVLTGVSAAVGGAWLAWLVAHSMDRSLRFLERAMARVRGGDFSARVPVSALDEIGAAEEGFNQMAQRLSESYEAIEARNRELAGALDRISFLEKVKHGLDRFVPETVRRLIEANPDAPGLEKMAKDVTVLFLDIEGYTRLSEELPREKLNDLIEHYFSLYLPDIHAAKGDINETAGDGLMILFQQGNPDEHALSAVRAALAIADNTVAANRGAGETHPQVLVNIGICSGVCHVGSTRIQSVAGERWTFTATGQVTNLAARLGNHAQNGQILLSSETAERVRGRFSVRKLGRVPLKNVSEPVEIWSAEH